MTTAVLTKSKNPPSEESVVLGQVFHYVSVLRDFEDIVSPALLYVF